MTEYEKWYYNNLATIEVIEDQNNTYGLEFVIENGVVVDYER
jgi:hypothetical protein